jgi:hypothetical protein
MSTSQFSNCDDVLDEYRLNSPASGLHFYTNILVVIMNVVFSAPGIFLNAVIFVSYLTNERFRRSCSCNLLLVALAVPDFMVNAIVQPIIIVKKVQEILGLDGCSLGVVLKITTYSCCGCSLAVMVILSVERFITLAFPYRHPNIVNCFRLQLTLISTWSIILLLTISNYFIPSIVHFYLAAGYISFCIITILMIWLWIQRLIVRHKRQILQEQSIETTTRRKVLSTTKTSFVLITILLICYFPSIVTNLYTIPNGSDFSLYFLVYPWILSFLYGRSTLTPLFIFWRKNVFGNTAKTICYGLICRSKQALRF